MQLILDIAEYEAVRWALKDRYMACLRRIDKCRVEKSEEIIELYEEEADRCKAILQRMEHVNREAKDAV